MEKTIVFAAGMTFKGALYSYRLVEAISETPRRLWMVERTPLSSNIKRVKKRGKIMGETWLAGIINQTASEEEMVQDLPKSEVGAKARSAPTVQKSGRRSLFDRDFFHPRGMPQAVEAAA